MAADRLAGTVGAIALLVTGAARADVTISTKPTQNMSCQAGVCSPTASKAVLNVGDLAGMLASTDVKISSGSLAQDIDVDAALRWTSTSRLTLDSYHSIAFNRPVVVAGTGALTITTDDGGKNGDFSFFGKGHVEFWDTNSGLIINGDTYLLVRTIKDLHGDIRHNGQGSYALAKSINTGNRTYFEAPIAGFGGTFEGLGNAISHLTIDNSSDAQDVGLFGELISSAIVRDIGLISVNIDGHNADGIGALVGQLADNSTVENSYATGQITGGSGSFVGGLVGKSLFTWISNSQASVALSAGDGVRAIGGLVGYLYGDCKIGCSRAVDQSFASGLVTAPDGASVGGLIGYSFGGVVTNSYATSTVSGGGNAQVGGLIGTSADNTDVHTGPVLSASYSTGTVTAKTGAMIGGLIGQDAADSQITNSYWDLDTSGINDPSHGAGNVQNDPGITGLTDAQLKSGLPAGFSPSIWKEKPTTNTGYPYLIDNPPPKKQDAPARP